MTFHEEEALRLFREGYSCSQAVFAAFSDITGIEKNTALRMSAPFGGGMGRLREVCGALSGAFLTAGCLWGYDNIQDKSLKTEHYKLIAGMAHNFSDVFGSYICREILDIKDYRYSPEAEERTPGFYAMRPCEKCVVTAARILQEEIEKRK